MSNHSTEKQLAPEVVGRKQTCRVAGLQAENVPCDLGKGAETSSRSNVFTHGATGVRALCTRPLGRDGKVWGPDHGHPVLCLHGWADNCGTFNTLIPLLPKECRYVAVDMAGHGLSSHRPPGVFYCFPAYVADVLRVVDDLQWTRFSIIGHSMGANIAAMFSALYPERVDVVILLDAAGFLPTDNKELPKMMRQGMDQMLQYEKRTEEKKRVYTYEKAAERLLAANPTLSEQSVSILLERGLAPVEGGFVFSRDLRLNFKNIVRLSLEQSLEMQARIRAAVLVVLANAGNGFGASSPDPRQKELASTVLRGYLDRNDATATVPGGHHVHLNNPEVVAPFVSDFLQTKVISQQQSGQTDTL